MAFIFTLFWDLGTLPGRAGPTCANVRDRLAGFLRARAMKN